MKTTVPELRNGDFIAQSEQMEIRLADEQSGASVSAPLDEIVAFLKEVIGKTMPETGDRPRKSFL